MLVLGGVIPFSTGIAGGNMLNSFFTASNNDLSSGVSINTEFQDVVQSIPEQSGGTTTGIGFIDAIKLMLGVFEFIINTLTAPIQLLFNMNIPLPTTFRILVGLPLTIGYIFAILFFLRGNE